MGTSRSGIIIGRVLVYWLSAFHFIAPLYHLFLYQRSILMALGVVTIWSFCSLRPILQSFHFHFEVEEDVVIWAPSQHGLFSLSTAHDLLRHRGHQHQIFRYVWSSTFPPKVSLFCGAVSICSCLSRRFW